MKIVKQTVNAKPRKLKAEWTMETFEGQPKPKWMPDADWPDAPKSIPIVVATIYEFIKQAYADYLEEHYNDLTTMHGIDVEAEIIAPMSQEIKAEIDQSIIDDLITLATEDVDTGPTSIIITELDPIIDPITNKQIIKGVDATRNE